MKKFHPQAYHNLFNVIRDYEELSVKNILDIITSSNVADSQRENLIKLLDLKIQEGFQKRMLQKQNRMVVATWILAAATIIATFINFA